MTPQVPCESTQASFSDYLDGALNGRAMQQIAQHLETCSNCAEEFDAWRTVQNSLAMLSAPRVPEDLALKLRIAISHENSRRSSSIWDALGLHWTNTFRPFVFQASAGFVVAVALLGTVGFLLGAVAVPQAVLANDEPLGAITAPHYLYSVENPRPIRTEHDETIVIDALVNNQGRVYDYTIVSGPHGPSVLPQIENQLLLSVFQPASVFGTPIRGRVILTYSGVSVRG